MTVCPACAHDWPRDSMSGISVELIGACLWCTFGPTRGSGADGCAEQYERVHSEYMARKARIVYADPRRK